MDNRSTFSKGIRSQVLSIGSNIPDEFTPEQLLQKDDAITYKVSIDAYLAAQKPPVIGPNKFDSLPSDVVVKIANEHLPCSDARRLANTCRSLFYKERLIPVTRRAADEVHQFLVHVMNGNLEAARGMLENDPGLILEEHSVGEHQWVTALLLARRMGDIGMCQMLLERLRAYDDQCRKRFNSKVDRTISQIASVSANSQKKVPLDVRNFDLVANAIATHQFDVVVELTRHHHPLEHQMTDLSADMDACRAAIDLHGECTAEDMANVVDALVKNAGKFITYEQSNLFFLQVVGYVARKVPLCFRMALNQSIWRMLQHNNVVDLGKRQTTCVVNNRRYSLVDFAQNSGLGFDFAFDALYAASACVRRNNIKEWLDFKNFCRATESALVELKLMQSISEHKSQPQPEELQLCRCVIC